MLEQLTKIIWDYTGDHTIAIEENSSLQGDIGLNSFDLISMITEIEDTFEVEISDSALKDIKTVGDVIKLVSTLKE